MAKPNFPEKQTPTPWGTWEELLLTCAVARHGTESWDAVAGELRKRTAVLASLSPHNCKQRFHDLRRRFSPPASDAVPIPFLDELRRLRVAELRREVERHDLSIVSLETKVEKLKEEREQSLTEKPDLEAPPENSAGKEDSGSGVKAAEKEIVVEDSYDGSSETVAAKESAKEKEEIGARVGGGDSAESKEENGERLGGDSAESKEESSTSLARKKLDEPEESEDGKRAHSGNVESQTLVGLLEILRSHKAGSLFERRQEIQEVPSYTNTIKQHIDFETMRMRLEEGWYSNCKAKFLRDLMLMITNATVFFDKKAPISLAAAKLRPIVHREMTALILKPEEPKTEPSKPKISVPMNACRKRSSIAARAGSTSSSGPGVGWKPSEKSPEEVPAVKKGKKDKAAKANTRSNNSSNEKSAPKPEKKESGPGPGPGKKQSAANFLNRMKRASPAVEPAKDSGGKGSAGGKQKDPATPPARRSAKQAKEPESPAKRSVGRPSKRPAPAAPPAKRSKPSGEADVAAARNAKKRARK